MAPGKLGRMLSFTRRKKKDPKNQTAAKESEPATAAAPTPAKPPAPQPVAASLKKMQACSVGDRQTFMLYREVGKPLGVGLAMDSASDSGGRAVIYAVRDGSSAATAGLSANVFLTGLQLIWTVRIVRGLWKAIAGGGSKEE